MASYSAGNTPCYDRKTAGFRRKTSSSTAGENPGKQAGCLNLRKNGRKNMEAKSLIERFSLIPHPEGGYYRETYRSGGTIPAGALPPAFGGDRHYSTAIVFLLEKGDISRLHRIRSDEIWHFYGGGPLRLAMISPDGMAGEIILGSDIGAGHHVQYVVPAGVWFGARPCAETAFSLVGCTVAPGFDFADFEMGEKETLKAAFPKGQSCIEEFG